MPFLPIDPCTGYDKSKDKTESCKKQSVAQVSTTTVTNYYVVKCTNDTYLSLSKRQLLNDDTYRWNGATVIMSSFGQIE